MKFSTILPVAFLAFASAAPVAEPQDIDFDAYEAVPVADDMTAPVGTTVAEVIAYNPSAAASSAIAAATNEASPDLQKRVACASNTPGNYPTVSPDTAEAFVADPTIASIANSAVAPPGYFLSDGYKNLAASASNPSYKTYVSSSLTSYDTAKCAALCNAMTGCNSFNIYFERNPSIILNKALCPDSSSITRIKCSFFGSAITVADATNEGQYQNDFHIVIAGSNTYTLTPQPIPGFTGPVSLGNASIVSPTSAGTYMGVQTFLMTQPYDPSVCAAACKEKSAYNLRHATSAAPARICVFFDAYIMYKNGLNGVFTCTYYTQSYGPAFATNFGQFDNSGNHFTIDHSYTYTLNTPVVV